MFGALLATCVFVRPGVASAECENRLETAIRAFRADPTAIEKARALDDAAGQCVDEARGDFAEAARLAGTGGARDVRLLLAQGNSVLLFMAEKEEELGVPVSDADALGGMLEDHFRVIVIPGGTSTCVSMTTTSLVPLGTEDGAEPRHVLREGFRAGSVPRRGIVR